MAPLRRNIRQSAPIDVIVNWPCLAGRSWSVDTQAVQNGACISREGEGEFGETNLLTDVNAGLVSGPGHIVLNFGFTVTAAG